MSQTLVATPTMVRAHVSIVYQNEPRGARMSELAVSQMVVPDCATMGAQITGTGNGFDQV